MTNIYDFKIELLSEKIVKSSVKQVWINLLATHLKTFGKFEYILESKEYKNAKLYDIDLLEGLSIGEIGVLYEYSVSFSDNEARKAQGQYFTPDDVALFMATQGKSFGEGIWLDPCSGIGNLSWHLVSIQEDPERFLLKNLILSDIDEVALLIARTLFTVSFQSRVKDLFLKIEQNFIQFDFLSVSDGGNLDLFESKKSLQDIPKHDYVIMNPPYRAVEANESFETAQSGDLYSYFLENVIKTSIGFVSITPQSFTNAKKFNSLRNLLLKSFKALIIYNFDNVPANIFRGIKFGSKNSNQVNSTRAAIIVAHNSHKSRQISPLIRWKSEERPILFERASNHLSQVPLTKEFFPKVDKSFENLYQQVEKLPILGSLISSKPTKFPLYIPSSPRYFISALIKPVDRASQKTIFFMNARDRNSAYMLLNSSFFFWWWRVRDGGMTLSLETILSVPLLSFELDENLIEALKRSEKKNRVYKMNAGAPQENVKHTSELIFRLNQHLLPKYANLLIKLHENSDISSFQ